MWNIGLIGEVALIMSTMIVGLAVDLVVGPFYQEVMAQVEEDKQEVKRCNAEYEEGMRRYHAGLWK